MIKTVADLPEAECLRLRAWALGQNLRGPGRFESAVFSFNPLQVGVGTGLTWGTANSWAAWKHPRVPFRPRRLHVNVREPGLVTLSVVRACFDLEGQPCPAEPRPGDVDALVGGVTDGVTFGFRPHPLLKKRYGAHGAALSLPLLLPEDRLLALGTWSVHVPPTRMHGSPFLLCLDFEGLQWVAS